MTRGGRSGENCLDIYGPIVYFELAAPMCSVGVSLRAIAQLSQEHPQGSVGVIDRVFAVRDGHREATAENLHGCNLLN